MGGIFLVFLVLFLYLVCTVPLTQQVNFLLHEGMLKESETPSTGVERYFIKGTNTTQVRLLELDLPPRGETVLSLLSFFLSSSLRHCRSNSAITATVLLDPLRHSTL